MNRSGPSALPVAALLLVSCGVDGTAHRYPPDFKQAQGLTVCAAGSTVNGIDVSEWQGGIDWGQVAASGIRFAFIRVSDGSGHLDPTFATNWANAQANGIVVSPYQFYEPSEDANAQAQVVIDAVGKLGGGQMPAMMDVETATPNAGDVTTWLNAVAAGTGKTPTIYSSVGLWNRWFPNGGFGSYGLVVANWGVSCPSLPAGWGGWQFWQYADNTSVPGISGNVDGDVFNGTLGDLQTYANSDQAPRGYLDVAACDQVAGWSQDQDAPDQAINVDLYYGGPAGSGVPGQRTLAGNSRADLCTAIGSCNHGFSTDTPRGLMDGVDHPIHAYGIDANGSDNAELSDSPRTLNCAPAETGVRRHVTDPTSYAAWGFSGFQDVRPLSDAVFTSYAAGPDWPATPRMVQGAGDPAVYLVDGAFRRHVVSPTSAAEWHLDLGTVQQVAPADIAAMPQGPDLRERPTLIQGSGPEIDELDDPLPEVDAGSPETGTTSTSAASETTSATGNSSSSGTSSTRTATGASSTTTRHSGSGSSGSSSSSAAHGGSSSSSGSTSAGAHPAHPGAGCTQSDPGLELLASLAVLLVARRRGRAS